MERTARLVDDPLLRPHRAVIERRRERAIVVGATIGAGRSLGTFANAHEYYGLHRRGEGWVLREWAPNATEIWMLGAPTDWEEREGWRCTRLNDRGDWELRLPADALHHGDRYRLRVRWPGGHGDHVPVYARRVVQDAASNIFDAEVWAPGEIHRWRHGGVRHDAPLIYEAHAGMAQEREGVGTWTEFREALLPRIVDAGYNTIQLMAVMEHPYYGSFGYHVGSFFAASSRFGTPDELKALVDAAHGAGLAVIMDLVHSHAVGNQGDGLRSFDGTNHQYFHDGPRGRHEAWDSCCFDYGKPEVLHFLLSNCRYWLDEFRFDGFRFDGVTSMLYLDHGLGRPFDSYGRYFDEGVDEDAVVYLMLANQLIHEICPGAVTVAEDVSGFPGLAAPLHDGGCGFDYRLAMGVPDHWFRLVRDTRDEDWHMGHLWHELTNRRAEEGIISYVESHDQAIVGSKTLLFELVDSHMYSGMRAGDTDLVVERGIALHKMIRLATLGSAGQGYLNFMGNEFGHPEWVDFPREGNGWSYFYARRQWSLRDADDLKYHWLADFDRAMVRLLCEHAVLGRVNPGLLRADEDDHVLVFGRKPLFFFFNFHPTASQVDYRVEVPPGVYTHRLDTDAVIFGGQGRIAAEQVYHAEERVEGSDVRNAIPVYLPCRTALVLERTSR